MRTKAISRLTGSASINRRAGTIIATFGFASPTEYVRPPTGAHITVTLENMAGGVLAEATVTPEQVRTDNTWQVIFGVMGQGTFAVRVSVEGGQRIGEVVMPVMAEPIAVP
ncbi:MAG: hypothetical protein GWO44_22875 [Thermoplasmata archaeon]|nr:hypothetical protein [Thermoplasmata archaeon]NIY06028.1 hypothetical protein [Thermoplasmata archaeon]